MSTTTAFETGSEHELLARLAGKWAGQTLTWLDPTAEPAKSDTTANAELILGGRYLRLTYQSSMLEKPLAGEMLFAYDRTESQYSMAWVDSFHTNTAIMMSVGNVRADGGIDLLGGYTYEGAHWKWRTVVFPPANGKLIIAAFFIHQDGKETHAIETTLTAR